MWIENIDVRRSYKCLDKNVRFPSASTIRNRIGEFYKKAVVTIKSDLPPSPAKVAIALDGWSAPQGRQSFLGVKAYWISLDWQLQEATLAFKPIHGRHTGKTLSSVMQTIIEQFDLYDRVISYTTDNASNNTTMHAGITKWIAQQQASDGVVRQDISEDVGVEAEDNEADINASPEASGDEETGANAEPGGPKEANPDPMHVPCLAHVIQLALKELMGQIRITPSKDAIKEWDSKAAEAEIARIEKEIKSKKGKGKKRIAGLPAREALDMEIWLPLSLAKVSIFVVDAVVDIINVR
jgi:hypothetical protein